MDSVILVTFKIKGIPIPIKIASTNEPSREQLLKKISDLAKGYNLLGEIQFKKLLKESGHKMYIYEIGTGNAWCLWKGLRRLRSLRK